MKQFILSLLLAIAASSARLDAHAFIEHAEPAVGSKMQTSPNKVRIWFTAQIQPVLSAIKVFDPTDKQIDKKDTHVGGRSKALLEVSVPPLRPGLYKVVWRVVSIDGHPTTGHFTFGIIR